MEQFDGRVAVVTGGASGIGRAMAERFAREGMRVVLADIEEAVLARTVAELTETGAHVVGVPADVAVLADVEAVRERALREFGAVHVVCNNAGVAGGTVAHAPIEQWNWVMGVNLWGVIHGCVTFLPLLLEQDEGHVVNTASIAGLGGIGPLGVYCTTKFAVVGLSESLHHELAELRTAVKVSVLCPGFLHTNIYTSERNMPAPVRAVVDNPAVDPALVELILADAPGPEVAADAVFGALCDGRFWVLTHEDQARLMTATRLAAMTTPG
jgi:NAD(P)-dependent dehydrogenase (short-subunit alcohol dehydrogenase family)